ncbi:MAG: hypothetical protein HYX60_07725 [Legionella longbeachae]|nr:hypothetical protein [Legionella longbeachae]
MQNKIFKKNDTSDLVTLLKIKLLNEQNIKKNAIELSKQLKKSQSIEETINLINQNTGNVDIGICNQLITNHSDNWELVTSIYFLLSSELPALPNDRTYASFIRIAGKTGHFKEMYGAFKLAISKGLANNTVFSNFIDIAGKTGHFKKAYKAFRLAQNMGFADTILYSNLIDIAGKTGHFKEAHEAFKQANREELTNEITYNNFIEAAEKNGQHKLAEEVFSERLNHYIKQDSPFHLDFHGHNASTTLLTLEWLLKNGEAGNYTLITGKGNHSKTNKSPVILACDEFCKKYYLHVKINPYNTGRRDVFLDHKLNRTRHLKNGIHNYFEKQNSIKGERKDKNANRNNLSVKKSQVSETNLSQNLSNSSSFFHSKEDFNAKVPRNEQKKIHKQEKNKKLQTKNTNISKIYTSDNSKTAKLQRKINEVARVKTNQPSTNNDYHRFFSMPSQNVIRAITLGATAIILQNLL